MYLLTSQPVLEEGMLSRMTPYPVVVLATKADHIHSGGGGDMMALGGYYRRSHDIGFPHHV